MKCYQCGKGVLDEGLGSNIKIENCWNDDYKCIMSIDGSILDVYVYKPGDERECFEGDIEINYCPFCGEELIF